MSTDYYSALGVSKSASKAEIKKAFRAKAKQHHPDKGGSEAKFKEINEAYETLGNDQKRSQYDQFGAAGPMGGSGGGFGGFSGGGGFGGMEDIFSSFFGGGGGATQKPSRTRGRDLQTEIRVSFADSMNGTTRNLDANTLASCDDCGGAGGAGDQACSDCGGAGSQIRQVQTPLGAFQQRVSCSTCDGTGRSFASTCSTCHGQGRTEKSRTIEITVPQGVENGQTLRLRGLGEAGLRGGTAGDLYVTVQVARDARFRRSGLDLTTKLEVNAFAALAGTTQSIETFWGMVELEIPPLTPDGTKLRLRKKGVQTDSQQGDLLVVIQHMLPKKLNSKQASLLAELVDLT